MRNGLSNQHATQLKPLNPYEHVTLPESEENWDDVGYFGQKYKAWVYMLKRKIFNDFEFFNAGTCDL